MEENHEFCELLNHDEKLPYSVQNIFTTSGVPKKSLSHLWYNEFSLIYTFKGTCVHYVNGVELETPKNVDKFMTVVNARSAHHFQSETDDTEDTPSSVIVTYSLDFAQRYFPGVKDQIFAEHTIAVSDEVANIFAELSALQLNPSESTEPMDRAYDSIYIESLILKLLYFIATSVPRAALPSTRTVKYRTFEKMRKMTEYIQDNFRKPLSQDRIAKAFLFSPAYLSRVFRSYIGIGFVEYVTEVRLESARNDLLTSRMSIADVATSNGFTDARRLIIAFKNKYGITPLQYRKAYC